MSEELKGYQEVVRAYYLEIRLHEVCDDSRSKRKKFERLTKTSASTAHSCSWIPTMSLWSFSENPRTKDAYGKFHL